MATFQTDFDDETEYEARRWLMERARDRSMGDDTPFFLVASFMHPHDPYVAKPEFWEMYEDADIDAPSVPLSQDTEDPAARRQRVGCETADKPASDAETRRARRGYFANTTYFDSKVGALVRMLDEMGELGDTIIIVTSDHGDMLGERACGTRCLSLTRLCACL